MRAGPERQPSTSGTCSSTLAAPSGSSRHVEAASPSGGRLGSLADELSTATLTATAPDSSTLTSAGMDETPSV